MSKPFVVKNIEDMKLLYSALLSDLFKFIRQQSDYMAYDPNHLGTLAYIHDTSDRLINYLEFISKNEELFDDEV